MVDVGEPEIHRDDLLDVEAARARRWLAPCPDRNAAEASRALADGEVDPRFRRSRCCTMTLLHMSCARESSFSDIRRIWLPCSS